MTKLAGTIIAAAVESAVDNYSAGQAGANTDVE
jgi:hypothetical protein